MTGKQRIRGAPACPSATGRATAPHAWSQAPVRSALSETVGCFDGIGNSTKMSHCRNRKHPTTTAEPILVESDPDSWRAATALTGRRGRREVPDPDVPELHRLVVAQEADVAGGALQPRVLCQDPGSVMSSVSTSRIVVPLRITVIRVPLDVTSCWFHSPTGLRYPVRAGKDVVERPVLLPGLDVLVSLGSVVDDLQLDAVVGDVAGPQRRPDAESVVGAFEETKFETKHKISKLAVGEQIATAAGRQDDLPVFDVVAVSGLLLEGPAVQRLARRRRARNPLPRRTPTRGGSDPGGKAASARPAGRRSRRPRTGSGSAAASGSSPVPSLTTVPLTTVVRRSPSAMTSRRVHSPYGLSTSPRPRKPSRSSQSTSRPHQLMRPPSKSRGSPCGS